MKEFVNTFLGQPAGGNDFWVAFSWALVGAVLSLLLNVATRNPSTPNSPLKFSWVHLVADNFLRLVTTIILIVVFLRFLPDLTGIQLSPFAAFGVGFAWDKLAALLKNKGLLGRAKNQP